MSLLTTAAVWVSFTVVSFLCLSQQRYPRATPSSTCRLQNVCVISTALIGVALYGTASPMYPLTTLHVSNKHTLHTHKKTATITTTKWNHTVGFNMVKLKLLVSNKHMLSNFQYSIGIRKLLANWQVFLGCRNSNMFVTDNSDCNRRCCCCLITVHIHYTSTNKIKIASIET